MREIKYRAWITGLKTMIDCTGDCAITFDGSDNALITIWASDGVVDEFTSSEIMQFTGLRDSKGVDIYENDLVNISGSGLCRVEIQPYCGVVYIEINEDMCGTDAHDVVVEKEDIFVVGNIYENKVLLGE